MGVIGNNGDSELTPPPPFHSDFQDGLHGSHHETHQTTSPEPYVGLYLNLVGVIGEHGDSELEKNHFIQISKMASMAAILKYHQTTSPEPQGFH